MTKIDFQNLENIFFEIKKNRKIFFGKVNRKSKFRKFFEKIEILKFWFSIDFSEDCFPNFFGLEFFSPNFENQFSSWKFILFLLRIFFLTRYDYVHSISGLYALQEVSQNQFRVHILFPPGISDEPWDLDPHLVTCSGLQPCFGSARVIFQFWGWEYHPRLMPCRFLPPSMSC